MQQMDQYGSNTTPMKVNAELPAHGLICVPFCPDPLSLAPCLQERWFLQENKRKTVRMQSCLDEMDARITELAQQQQQQQQQLKQQK